MSAASSCATCCARASRATGSTSSSLAPTAMDDCRCVADLAALPERVDLARAGHRRGAGARHAHRDRPAAGGPERHRDPRRARGEGGHAEHRLADAREPAGIARDALGRASGQRRQLPWHPITTGTLRHDVHPGCQAARARRAGDAAGLRLAERRVRHLAAQPPRLAQPALRDHRRQPDGPDDGGPSGGARPKTGPSRCLRSTSRASGRSTDGA